MARLRTRLTRAAALHLPAAATVTAVERLLQGDAAANAAAEHQAEQHKLAAQLRAEAAALTPGWLGAQLDALAPTTPLGGPTSPTFVRIGQAHPLDDAWFPVVVPLLRAGHVAVDADARDPRVAGLLRALLLRLLAAAPPGSLRVRIVDSAEVGTTFEAFEPAALPPAVTDQEGLRRLLDEAERWVAGHRPPEDEITEDWTTADGTGTGGSTADGTGTEGSTLLLVIASLPELTDGYDFARISALAKAGPAGRLHVIAAGWPPPPLTAETTQQPLPYCTQVSLRNPHAWVGDPPGATFDPNGAGPSRLDAPVYLDADPPLDVIRRVCREVAVGPARVAGPDAVRTEGAPWPRYVALAARLRTVRRAGTAAVARHEAARAAALRQLATVRGRLGHQAVRFVEQATAAGLPAPVLVPSPRQIAAAQAALATTGAPPPVAATVALRGAAEAAESAEETFSGTDRTTVERRRSLAVYGLFAGLSALGQTPLLLLPNVVPQARIAVLPCAVLLPLVAFLVAWALLGVVAGNRETDRTPAPGDRGGDRMPVAGAAISLLGAVPLLVAAVLAMVRS